MSLVAGRLPAGRHCRPYTKRSTGAARLVVQSSAMAPFNPAITSKPVKSSSDSLVRQQTRHVVNFKASAADFHIVISRLALSCEAQLAELKSASPAVTTAPQPSTPATKPWGGPLGNILGGLRGGGGSQTEELSTTVESVQDDNSPLNHAVVMFTATWCGPCSVVYKELKLAAARLHGRAPTAIIVVDVEENKELASELGIKALPTVLYLSPNGSRGPIFTQGPVSAPFILDAMDRAVGFGGRDVKAKWLKL